MAHYFIGDIQGCFEGLQRALAEVDFNSSKDTLWLTGDLIARGSDSLSTLKFLYKNQDSIKTVLGNHDLHLLAVANGLKKANLKDLLQPLLTAPKLDKYLDWLRHQPLIQSLPKKQGFMTHAGLPPHWNSKKAVKWATRVSEILQSADYTHFLADMYGNKPNNWQQCNTEQEKLRFTVNALTRMRFCTIDGCLDFSQKGSPEKLEEPYSKNNPQGLMPWFDFQPERFDNMTWVFGHWASLMGETNNSNIIALDTGYVWGNYLTVMKFKTREFSYIHHHNDLFK